MMHGHFSLVLVQAQYKGQIGRILGATQLQRGFCSAAYDDGLRLAKRSINVGQTY
jgi:hypothetical protein